MARPFRLTPPRLSENDIEAQCLSLLTLKRYWVCRLHAGVFKTLDGLRHIRGVPKGTPDYVCLHGTYRNFLMEVKRPGGTLRPDQDLQIRMIREQFDLPTLVVSDVEDLGKFLERHERSP